MAFTKHPIQLQKGQRFTRLVVIREVGRMGKYVRCWECICDCKTKKIVRQENLISGSSRSCGCLHREAMKTKRPREIKTHAHTRRINGKLRSPTYISWQSMKSRCYAPNTHGFHNWGGKGIKVCDEWRRDFTAFLRDMGERPQGKTIDRKNPHGDYTLQNCRWATPKEQTHDRKMGTPPKLSLEQKAYIKANPSMTTRELAERFNVSIGLMKKTRRQERGYPLASGRQKHQEERE